MSDRILHTKELACLGHGHSNELVLAVATRALASLTTGEHLECLHRGGAGQQVLATSTFPELMARVVRLPAHASRAGLTTGTATLAVHVLVLANGVLLVKVLVLRAAVAAT